MATVAENELREFTDLINNRFHELDKKIDDRFNDLKDDIKAIDKKLDIQGLLKKAESLIRKEMRGFREKKSAKKSEVKN